MGQRDRKNPLLDHIRRIATLQQLRQMTDRELLAHFVNQGDEAAFRILMDRYGPLVLRTCKHVLDNDHDAEDAYQAVFLVLISEAGSQRTLTGSGSDQNLCGGKLPSPRPFPEWLRSCHRRSSQD